MHKIILLFDIGEEYGQKLLKGIARYSKENGPWIFCRMPLFYRETLGMKGIVKFAREWEADGIIGQLYNNDDIKQILNAGIHVIAQDFKERFSNIPNITGGYFEAGEMGARYFLKKGFKNFAFYGFKNIVWSRERSDGFEHYLRSQGYKVHYFDQDMAPTRELWFYKPSVLSQWLQSLPKPVAIMTCDDERGQHITEACKQVGIQIPEEMAILGVDNDEMTCNLSDPPLSSIALNTEKGGYEAAKLMDEMITGKIGVQYDIYVMPTQIVERQSTDIASTSDRYIAKALKFIHQNIEKRITVKDVLRQVPLSRRALEMRFQETTGTGVYKYIYNLQIEKFAQKLLDSDKTIFEIAIESGFESSKNISRQFKQIKGCTPAEYRRRHLSKR